jgi:hypothetical protein
MGLVELEGHRHCYPLGLVFQQSGRDLIGIKFQQVDFQRSDAVRVYAVNRILAASALPEYLKWGHRGLLAPFAYFRRKPTGKVETGIAYFASPSSSDDVPPDGDTRFDSDFGVGATAMIFHMARAIVVSSQKLGIRYQYFLTMERRPWTALGILALDFVVCGTKVVVIDSSPSDANPVWEYLVRAGFTTLPHAPMIPATGSATEA